MMMMMMMNLTHLMMMMMTLRMMTMSPQIALTQMKSPLKAQTIRYHLNHKFQCVSPSPISTHCIVLLCLMLINNV